MHMCELCALNAYIDFMKKVNLSFRQHINLLILHGLGTMVRKYYIYLELNCNIIIRGNIHIVHGTRLSRNPRTKEGKLSMHVFPGHSQRG